MKKKALAIFVSMSFIGSAIPATGAIYPKYYWSWARYD